MRKFKIQTMTLTEALDPVQTVAEGFAAQYTDEDLHIILSKSPSELKDYLQAVSASNLQYAISILPGRPSRPSKPTV